MTEKESVRALPHCSAVSDLRRTNGMQRADAMCVGHLLELEPHRRLRAVVLGTEKATATATAVRISDQRCASSIAGSMTPCGLEDVRRRTDVRGLGSAQLAFAATRQWFRRCDRRTCATHRATHTAKLRSTSEGEGPSPARVVIAPRGLDARGSSSAPAACMPRPSAQGRPVDRPQPASCFFTSVDTRPMSAWPASLGLSAPISLPISAGLLAPVSATAAWIAATISASPIFAGR